MEHADHAIEEMAEVEVATKEELRELEGFYVKNNNCVNERIPSRTQKQWEEENRERMLEHHKQYYEANKKAIAERASAKSVCDCGGRYTYASKSTHSKSIKHISYMAEK